MCSENSIITLSAGGDITALTRGCRLLAALLVAALASTGRAPAQGAVGLDDFPVFPLKTQVFVDTDYGDDGLVPNLGASNCSISLGGNPETPLNVTIQQPETGDTGGVVSFEPSAFTLPSDGQRVPFTLFGVSESQKVDDVKLKVTDGMGEKAGGARATVYLFGTPKLGIMQGTSYRLGPIRDPKTGLLKDAYQPEGGGHAAYIAGSLEVKPHGVRGSRILGTHIALVQNIMGGSTVTFTHNGPVRWYAPYGPANPVHVPVSVSILHEVPVWTADAGGNGEYPQLYEDADVAMRGDDLAQVSTNDSPNSQFLPQNVLPVDVRGVQAVDELYGNPAVKYDEQFRDWLVTYEASAPYTMTYWAEATWNLITPNVGATPMRAELGASSIPPADAPTMPIPNCTLWNNIPNTTSFSADTFLETHP